MSTYDCFVVFGPIVVFSVGVAIAFGVHSYVSFKNGVR